MAVRTSFGYQEVEKEVRKVNARNKNSSALKLMLKIGKNKSILRCTIDVEETKSEIKDRISLKQFLNYAR